MAFWRLSVTSATSPRRSMLLRPQSGLKADELRHLRLWCLIKGTGKRHDKTNHKSETVSDSGLRILKFLKVSELS